MILNLIEKKLSKKRDSERQEVMRLKWKKAELEKKIEEAKRRQIRNVDQ